MIAANEWWQSRRPERQEPSAWGGIILRKLLFACAASVATTLVASIATAPFAAFHFQRLNPYGLIGNALAIPFVSLIVMPAAVAGTLLLPFGLDGPVWQLMGLGSQKVVEVARHVAALDGSVRGTRAFGSPALLLMAGGFLLVVLPRAPVRVLGFAPFGAGLALALTPPAADIMVDREGRLAVYRAPDGRLAVLGKATSRFTIDRWLAADGDTRNATSQGVRGATRCDAFGCVGRLSDGAAVALVLETDAFEEDCRRAKFLITPLTAPAFCSTTTTVVDRERLSSAASIAVHRSSRGFNLTSARPLDRWKPWFGRPQGLRLNAASSSETDSLPSPSRDEDGADLLMP
jgi:competence protein ComEC